jgi:uncharacterized membrane protein
MEKTFITGLIIVVPILLVRFLLTSILNKEAVKITAEQVVASACNTADRPGLSPFHDPCRGALEQEKNRGTL